MGSEHSTHSNSETTARRIATLRRHQTIANPSSEPENGSDHLRSGSISPGPSVCSDTELPYISYTVNRPIGDSPKLTNRQPPKQRQKKMQKLSRKSLPTLQPTPHSIVVVRPEPKASDADPDVMRLRTIPMFLPIMRATLSLPAARDPEVLERLDPGPLHRLCQRYQCHLTRCANVVTNEQNAISLRQREIDQDVIKMVALLVERQKKFAKYAERLATVQEISHQLNRCHTMLNQTLESMETLNNYLSIDERLESFVWTTG